MKIDELGLQIGCPLQIQMLDDESKVFTVQLIGYYPGEAMVISAPLSEGSDLSVILGDDQPLKVRIESIRFNVAFDTHIIDKRLTPYAHIHLAIPDDIDNVFDKKAEMVTLQQDATFINNDDSCHSQQSDIVAIGYKDILVKHFDDIAEIGQRCTVTMSFHFAGKNNVIVLEGRITKINKDPDSAEKLFTLTYEDLDQSDKILLHAYIYECLLMNLNLLADPGKS